MCTMSSRVCPRHHASRTSLAQHVVRAEAAFAVDVLLSSGGLVHRPIREFELCFLGRPGVISENTPFGCHEDLCAGPVRRRGCHCLDQASTLLQRVVEAPPKLVLRFIFCRIWGERGARRMAGHGRCSWLQGQSRVRITVARFCKASHP